MSASLAHTKVVSEVPADFTPKVVLDGAEIVGACEVGERGTDLLIAALDLDQHQRVRVALHDLFEAYGGDALHDVTVEPVHEDQPALFEAIQQRVKEGRWEPMGGMWVDFERDAPEPEHRKTRTTLLGRRGRPEKRPGRHGSAGRRDGR